MKRLVGSGHALHETVDFDWTAEPITDYASTNTHEAFAEAFEAYIVRDGLYPVLQERDPATVALFERLAV